MTTAKTKNSCTHNPNATVPTISCFSATSETRLLEEEPRKEGKTGDKGMYALRESEECVSANPSAYTHTHTHPYTRQSHMNYDCFCLNCQQGRQSSTCQISMLLVSMGLTCRTHTQMVMVMVMVMVVSTAFQRRELWWAQRHQATTNGRGPSPNSLVAE